MTISSKEQLVRRGRWRSAVCLCAAGWSVTNPDRFSCYEYRFFLRGFIGRHGVIHVPELDMSIFDFVELSAFRAWTIWGCQETTKEIWEKKVGRHYLL